MDVLPLLNGKCQEFSRGTGSQGGHLNRIDLKYPRLVLAIVFLCRFYILFIVARRSPFIVGVNFDSNELTGTSMADAKSTDAESSEVPAGHVGFKLTYFQVAC